LFAFFLVFFGFSGFGGVAEQEGDITVLICDENGWCGEVVTPPTRAGVTPTWLRSCRALGGDICKESEFCPGKWLKSRDERCCSVACREKAADLKIKSLSVEWVDGKYRVGGQVENIGNRDADRFAVAIKGDSLEGKVVKIFFFEEGLEFGKTADFNAVVMEEVFEVGKARLFYVVADALEEVEELDERNNWFIFLLTERAKRIKIVEGVLGVIYMNITKEPAKIFETQEIWVYDEKQMPLKNFVVEIISPTGEKTIQRTDNLGRIRFLIGSQGVYGLRVFRGESERVVQFFSGFNWFAFSFFVVFILGLSSLLYFFIEREEEILKTIAKT